VDLTGGAYSAPVSRPSGWFKGPNFKGEGTEMGNTANSGIRPLPVELLYVHPAPPRHF